MRDAESEKAMRSLRSGVRIPAALVLVAILAACNGKGIQDAPEDINVSPRS